MPESIPLSHAIICFNLSDSNVRVLKYPDFERDRDHYSHVFGACDPYWLDSDVDVLRGEFLIHIWHSVALYGVPATKLHEALLIIPEYREMIPVEVMPKAYR